MLHAPNPTGLVFFPAFDWAISPTHPEREERLLYTQDQVLEEGLFDVEGIVAGNVFSGTIYRRVPLNNEIDAISFEATVAGDSATVSPFSLLNELTLDLCEVVGVYSATRAP